MKYWLMKSEPSTFSIDDLAAAPRQISCWDGVRNYQARNLIRDEMRRADRAFFYHSGCETPGIVGIMEIVSAGYPDHTAFDPTHVHYDPGSRRDEPRWYMVDVRFVQRFVNSITLDELRAHARKKLAGLVILRPGNRLSVTPVSAAHWKFIVGLAKV